MAKMAVHPTVSVPDSSPDDLLPGEVLVGHAPNTQQLLYESDSPEKLPGYITGTLYVTNNKLSFKPTPFLAEKLSALDQAALLTSKSVSLRLILQAYTVSGGRRRLVTSKTTLPKKISELEIICKDMRKIVFSFKLCPKADAIHVVNSLGMYSSPSTIYHLFAFDYARVVRSKKDTIVSSDSVPSFFNPRDWQKELDRLGVNQKQWRVTESNNRFLLCESLPPYIVVPYNISDDTLEYVASLHTENRLPVWCWSHPHSGVSLTRASLPDEDQLEAPDPSYMYAVSMARNLEVQVENKQVTHFKIPNWCSGTAKDIQNAYMKLHELCTTGTCHDLSRTDQRWYSTLESSQWMHYVRSCLLLAREIANTLCTKRSSCILLGHNDRDLSCVISSLVQVICDPHFRSISGFEALIQKEWVSLGHPFTTRCGLVTNSANEEVNEGQAPIFLLFCDCIWQLTCQFPSAFQFSDTYLLNLFSLLSSCTYGNFIFDSARARLQASLHSKRSSYYGTQDDQYGISDAEQYEGPLVSAWGNWRSSLSAEENEQWLNPFYYIFGSGDAHNDYTIAGSFLPFESSHFNAVFSDMLPDKVIGGNFGLYTDQPIPISLNNHDITKDRNESFESPESYQSCLILPNTSMYRLVFWSKYFFKYIPEFSATVSRGLASQLLQNRLVKNVRKLKENLNDLELEQGCQTSDLFGFIGEIMKARETEKRLRQLKMQTSQEITRRMSAFVSVSSEDEEGDRSLLDSSKFSSPLISVQEKAKTLPTKLDESLTKFADELYNNGETSKNLARDRILTSSTGGGRSPVLKTKITVQKEETNASPSSPASRWVGTSQLAAPLNTPIMPSPPIPLHKKTSGVVEGTRDEIIDL